MRRGGEDGVREWVITNVIFNDWNHAQDIDKPVKSCGYCNGITMASMRSCLASVNPAMSLKETLPGLRMVSSMARCRPLALLSSSLLPDQNEYGKIQPIKVTSGIGGDN